MAVQIQTKRKREKLTQEQLARLLKVSVNTVARWERGALAPKGKRLERVEKFLNS